MIITAITPQKRNKNFYNIQIDDEYFCSMDDETIYQLKLKEGIEVDPELLAKAAKQSAYKKALNYSLNLLAKSYRTRQELIKKLKEKEYNTETIADVVARIEELGYINDERYTEVFISSKQGSSQGLNKRTLYNKLLQKGIDKELAQKSLENSSIDEYKNAVQAAEKKLRSLKGSEKEKKAKLYSFLMYKGFSYDICAKVISNLNFTE